MSSYSDLATAIINKNGQGGKFSGLNNALDLRQAFKDAATQFAYQQQLAKEQGYNTGAAGIINASNLYGTNPINALTQFQQVVNAGPTGQIPPSVAGAGAMASGGIPSQDTSMPTSAPPSTQTGTGQQSIAQPTPSQGQAPQSSEPVSTYADPSKFNEQQALADGLTPQRVALLKEYALADPTTGQYKRDSSALNMSRNPAQIALSSQLAKYAPDLNSQIASQQKEFINSDWNKGDLSKIRLATENLTQHLQVYGQYQSALQNGNVQAANGILNSYRQQTGNSNITNAATLARAAGVETAKVLSQNGVLSNEQYNDALKNLPTNASPQQSQDAIHDMMQISQPRINSVLERYHDNFGVYPPNAFSPQAISAIKNVAPDVYNELAPKLRVNGVTQQPVPETNQGQTQGQSGQIAEGTTATNPQTGHTLTYSGGKWQ